ncbi:MAG: DUF3466 family protein [Pirellulaceae bacterium]|nr:DUF3466 family protein [Pirellulaceae bacterium]
MNNKFMLVLFLAAALAAPSIAWADYYEIIDLGLLPGLVAADRSYGNAVNNGGEVAGHCQVSSGSMYPPYYASLYSGGSMSTLGGELSGYPVHKAWGINDGGQVVGETSVQVYSPSSTLAFISSGGTMTSLGTLGAGTKSYAYAINNSGQVVGSSTTDGSSNTRAFIWDGTNGMQSLGVLDGGNSSIARGINSLGQVVGESTISDKSTPIHAFLWDGTNGMVSLGTLGNDDSRSWARSINDAGQVVGYSDTSGTGATRAFLWTADNGMESLGVLGSGDNSYAKDINNNGWVVGYSNTSGASTSHAFVWDSANGIRDLNDLIDPALGWTLTHADSISDTGYITGYGTIGGQTRAFLLSIPEPSTFALLACGLAALLAYAWRRRK